MASLAEHLSGPSDETAPVAAVPITAKLAPVGLFCLSLTLFVFSCSVLASSRAVPTRR